MTSDRPLKRAARLFSCVRMFSQRMMNLSMAPMRWHSYSVHQDVVSIWWTALKGPAFASVVLLAFGANAQDSLCVRGELVRTVPRENRVSKLAFEAQFGPTTNYVTVFGNIDELHDRFEWSFDGSNSVAIQHIREDYVSERVPHLVDGRVQWTNGPPRRPRNNANVYLTKGPIPPPALNLAIPLWLGFGSASFRSNCPAGKMPKLFDLEREVRKTPLLLHSTIELSDFPPYCPSLVINTSEYRGVTTNEAFRVLAWQDYGNKRLPTRLIFEIYNTYYEPKGNLASVTECRVTNLVLGCTGDNLTLAIPAAASVHDARFPNVKPLHYFSTNQTILSAAEIERSKQYRLNTKTQPANAARHLLLAKVVIFSLFAVPLAVFAVKRLVRKPKP